MRHFLLLSLFLHCSLQLYGKPIPSDKIIKYRVSSKYFNRSNGTVSEEENSNSLFNLLTQIHFGGSNDSSKDKHVERVNEDKASNDVTFTTIANDHPESESSIVTEENQHQMDDEKTSDEEALSAPIEKVVNDEIEKLANADGEEKSPAFETTVDSEAEKSFTTTTEAAAISSLDEEQTETTTAIAVIESVDLDSETIETTNTPEIATQDGNSDAEQMTAEGEREEDDSKIPQSLLSAVGDLLSSVLGISYSDDEDEESEKEEEQIPMKTNDEVVSTTLPIFNNESMSDNNKPNEVDLKIENLATSFMTENTPEQYVESETSDVKSEDDDDETVLEVISELASEGDEAREPVSFEESVNHVMNLVKGTEGRLALEAAQNVVDSILIGKHDNVNALDQIVYGTLKEIGGNVGLSESDTDNDEGIKEPAKTVDPVDQQREEMIRNFESDIHESLVNAGPFDTLENFVPNTAKAALYYKYQYDDDF